MSYQNHDILYRFYLQEGVNGEKTRVIELSNLKSTVHLDYHDGISSARAQINLFGLSVERITELSYSDYGGYGQSLMIEIEVDQKQVFSGTVTQSFADLNEMPNTPLMIYAYNVGVAKMQPSKAFSAPGDVQVRDILEAIAKPLGWSVKMSEELNVIISNPHFSGDPVTQITDVCKAAGLVVVLGNGVVEVFSPYDKHDNLQEVSQETGMIGVPVFIDRGQITVRKIFSSDFKAGTLFHLKSKLPNLSGKYYCTSVTHQLSSRIPGGDFFTIATGAKMPN